MTHNNRVTVKSNMYMLDIFKELYSVPSKGVVGKLVTIAKATGNYTVKRTDLRFYLGVGENIWEGAHRKNCCGDTPVKNAWQKALV